MIWFGGRGVIVYNARDVGKVRSAVALAYAAADEGCYSNIRRTVVVVRSKAINHLHLAMVLMSTVGLSSLFSFILKTHMVL